ncbi:MAG: ABC transporter ATP-binding protein/permease [Maledivibacter sp.]|jgi:ATP-binding cassette subfamily B protein|nr:ABC transporter ATP-binding protein/permease [Maledivibacter sp.]
MAKSKENNKGLWAIIKPINNYMAGAIVLAVIQGILMILGNMLLANIMGIILGGELQLFGLSLNFRQSFWLLTLVIIITFTIRYYSFIVSHLGAFKLETILRKDLTSRLADVPLGYVITIGTGSLKKVLLDDVKNLHVFVADSIPLIGKSATTPIISLIAMLTIDWRIALVAVGVLILGMILMYGATKDDAKHRQRYEQSQSDINKAVIEFVQAMPVVRTFDDGSTSSKRYNVALERYRHYTKTWINLTAIPGKIALIILSPLPTILAVTGVGMLLVFSNELSLSGFIAAIMVSTGLAEALMPLMWFNQALKKSHASAVRIHETNDLPILTKPKVAKVPSSFDVTFNNVSFSYNNNHIHALKNINFTVPEETTSALIGPSGAGKSTVARLIPRFWDVTEGSIRIGGIDIRDMDSNILMDTVSFVFQDAFLFNDTLEENIRIAKIHATKIQIIEAAKAAQIHEFIMSLPNGYETMAGDRGVNLSGGQKQRITIARAILRDTPIIVFDEATAYADPENEEEIVKALSNLMRHKTVIVIAHKLSTIKDVQQIIAFDKGKLTESGTHDELLALGGTYANLWKNYTLAQNWDVHHKGGAI